MNRIDILFGILILLQSKNYLTGECIAERFGISIRTVYRDLRALGEQGVPIDFEPQKIYFVVKGYFLPPVSFSSEEANALLLMEALVYGFADKSIQQHYSTALNKVKAVLGSQQKEKLAFLNNNIRLQIPACLQQDLIIYRCYKMPLRLKKLFRSITKTKITKLAGGKPNPLV